MPAFRDLFALLLCAAFIAALTYWILRALRTGTLRHSDTVSKVTRAKQPVRYWSLLAVFVAMDAWICGVAVVVLQRVWSA